MVSGRLEGEGPAEALSRVDGDLGPSRSANQRMVRRLASARTNLRGRRPSAASRALAHLVFTAGVVGVTYLFTTTLTNPPGAAGPATTNDPVKARRIEELRAEDRQVLTTYSAPSPTSPGYRIPIDRAMELTAAEGGRPAALLGTSSPPLTAPAPEASATATPTANGAATAAPTAAPNVVMTAAPIATAPAPAPAPGGMAPVQLFRAVCFACHDLDGRGGVVRKAMPVIPDFTDPKWQASRTDADLTHSILQGKGQLMLPMKDKLELAHTDVKDMVAFIRSFQPGRAGTAPAAAAAAPSPAPTGPAPVTLPTAPSLAAAPVTLPTAPSLTPAPALPTALSPAPTVAMAGGASPAVSERAKVGGAFFSVNCIPCHGMDGRGSAVRPAMPVIPDFTSPDWHKTHQDSQLVMSILEGKGTLMPAWRGKVDPNLARDLVAFVRTFGPAGLAVSGQSTTDFGTRMKQLHQQWEELDRQARALSGH